MTENKLTELLGKRAALLSLIEMGLGSILHSYKVPLSGHFLSLNQIFILSHTTWMTKFKHVGLHISLATAALKSLSPAGKRLTPMLAITAQGMLFSLGVILLGVNLAGMLLGGLLSCLWAFVQPVLFIYLLYGQTSIDVATYFLKEINKFTTIDLNILAWAVAIFIGAKIILALSLVTLSRFISVESVEKYEQIMIEKAALKKKKEVNPNLSPFLLTLKDLAHPLFIISTILTGVFFYFAEASFAKTMWQMLRPLGIAFIIFYLVRIYPLDNLANFLSKIGLHGLAATLKKTISLVSKNRES
jgi:hypothetical protein